MHLQDGYARAIPMYVGVLHVLIHRLVREFGTYFSCFLMAGRCVASVVTRSASQTWWLWRLECHWQVLGEV